MPHIRLHIAFSLIGLLCALNNYAQTVENDTVEQTLCINDGGNILQTERIQLTENQTYIWTKEQNNVKDTLDEDSWRIMVTDTKDATYTCQLISTEVKAENNLMANGDFETNPPSNFTSDYKYAGWDPYQYYSDHGGASNLYAITHDATYFWKDFAQVTPHGGQYFALFDAGTSGDAWRASTADNPNLIIEEDSIYLFSYYAAYPNQKANNSPAELQFVIICKDANGKKQTFNLGNVHKLGQTSPLNAWELREERWKAPFSSNDVTISVYDKNTDSGGNDFCLDDIMFQNTSYIEQKIIKTYIFHLEVCNNPPCDDPVVHTKEDTTVYEKDLPIVWHGIEFTEATEDTVDVYDETTGCLTDRYIYSLTIKPMDPPCPELKDSIRELTVCDTLMPYTWEGHEFTQADIYSYIEQSPRGCDSIRHVLILYVEKCCPTPLIESDQLTICSNELPYTWHNILFTAAADSVIPNYDERGCLISSYTYRLTVRQGVEMYAKWTDVIFVRNIDSLYTAYQWYQNGQPIDGATEQFYHDPNGLTGRYHCVMQTRNGGSEETCPAAFQDLDRSAEHNPGDAPKQLVAQRTYNVGTHLQIIVSVFEDNSTTAEKYWKE